MNALFTLSTLDLDTGLASPEGPILLRLRKLASPAEAADLGELVRCSLSALAAAGQLPDALAGLAAGLGATPKPLTDVEAQKAEEKARGAFRRLVVQGSPDGGKTWHPLTLVETFEEQDESRGRLWIAAFPVGVWFEGVTRAWADYLQAQSSASRFHRQRHPSAGGAIGENGSSSGGAS